MAQIDKVQTAFYGTDAELVQKYIDQIRSQTSIPDLSASKAIMVAVREALAKKGDQ